MTNSMHRPCDEWSEKLAARIETLSPSDRAALEAHLALCPSCAFAQTDYQMMRRLLGTLPAPSFPAGLPPRLLQLWEDEDSNKLDERALQHSFSLSAAPWLQMAQQDGEPARSNTASTQEEDTPVDQILHCSLCGQDFLFTASDQAFFLQRGNTGKPKRCPSCLRASMHGKVPLDHPHGSHEKQ